MSKWAVHNKWVCKMGIPEEVAKYMQPAIDSKGPSDKIIVMPADFAKHCQEPKIPLAGHKDCGLMDFGNLHDRGKLSGTVVHKMVQQEDLKFLVLKGNDHVRAYYLHFILDYLDHPTIREYMNQGSTVSDCIAMYVRNKAVVVEGTGGCLTAVVDFLKARSTELEEDYHKK